MATEYKDSFNNISLNLDALLELFGEINTKSNTNTNIDIKYEISNKLYKLEQLTNKLKPNKSIINSGNQYNQN